jgi:hypothetical protein
MKAVLIVSMLTGCAVLHDAHDELNKDITGVQTEFARLYLQENSK